MQTLLLWLISCLQTHCQCQKWVRKFTAKELLGTSYSQGKSNVFCFNVLQQLHPVSVEGDKMPCNNSPCVVLH